MTKTVKKVKEEQKTRKCPMYRVLIHNDDVTTYTFVVGVLISIFHKECQQAANIAQEAHVKGLSLVEVMPLELAELRVDQAHALARTSKFPLKFTYEPE